MWSSVPGAVGVAGVGGPVSPHPDLASSTACGDGFLAKVSQRLCHGSIRNRFPPLRLFDRPVHFAMMHAAERNRELIAHLEAESPRLRKAQVMGIGGLPAANEAGLRGDKLTMVLIPQSARLGRDGEMFEV